jgi:hypothetical protein
MAKWSQEMLVRDAVTMKIFLSQNQIENSVLIILGRFPINKTQN